MDTKIQELTDKIYKEGVEKGNEEAGRIIADANAQKQAILTEAEAEAKRIVAQAEKQAAELKKNTEAELKLFATPFFVGHHQETELFPPVSQVVDFNRVVAHFAEDVRKSIPDNG